jgi:hypothetical protein
MEKKSMKESEEIDCDNLLIRSIIKKNNNIAVDKHGKEIKIKSKYEEYLEENGLTENTLMTKIGFDMILGIKSFKGMMKERLIEEDTKIAFIENASKRRLSNLVEELKNESGHSYLYARWKKWKDNGLIIYGIGVVRNGLLFLLDKNDKETLYCFDNLTTFKEFLLQQFNEKIQIKSEQNERKGKIKVENKKKRKHENDEIKKNIPSYLKCTLSLNVWDCVFTSNSLNFYDEHENRDCSFYYSSPENSTGEKYPIKKYGPYDGTQPLRNYQINYIQLIKNYINNTECITYDFAEELTKKKIYNHDKKPKKAKTQKKSKSNTKKHTKKHNKNKNKNKKTIDDKQSTVDQSNIMTNNIFHTIESTGNQVSDINHNSDYNPPFKIESEFTQANKLSCLKSNDTIHEDNIDMVSLEHMFDETYFELRELNINNTEDNIDTNDIYFFCLETF